MARWSLEHVADVTLDQVSLSEVKEHLRVTHDAENALLERVRKASLQRVGDLLNRSVHRSQWRLTYPDGALPAARIPLPRPPLGTIDSIEAWDEATDAWLPADLDDYVSSVEDQLSVVRPKNGVSWPTGRIRITYTAGYTSATIPDKLKQAVLEAIAWSYEHRGDAVTAQPMAANAFEEVFLGNHGRERIHHL